jgi:hypothetical protein
VGVSAIAPFCWCEQELGPLAVRASTRCAVPGLSRRRSLEIQERVALTPGVWQAINRLPERLQQRRRHLHKPCVELEQLEPLAEWSAVVVLRLPSTGFPH